MIFLFYLYFDYNYTKYRILRHFENVISIYYLVGTEVDPGEFTIARQFDDIRSPRDHFSDTTMYFSACVTVINSAIRQCVY
jgi:hypothetical protein